MIDKKRFKKIFDDQLKSIGFVYKSNSWYKENIATIVIFNLQKSDYSELYYINIAIWLKPLGNLRALKEQFCHIRLRADSFFKDIGYVIVKLLDFSNSSLDEDRSKRISSILYEHIIPFLIYAEKIENVKRLYKEGKFDNVFMHKDAKKILNSD